MVLKAFLGIASSQLAPLGNNVIEIGSGTGESNCATWQHPLLLYCMVESCLGEQAIIFYKHDMRDHSEFIGRGG